MVPYYLFLSLLVLFLTISILFLFHKHRSNFTAANLPPGRIGWPVLGESLAFLSAGRDGRPEKFFFDRTAKFPGAAEQEVFKTFLLGEPTAVMCGSASNKFIFANEDKLVTAWFPRSIVKLFPLSAPTGRIASSNAKKVRNLLSGFFKPEALRRNVGVMDKAARRHFADEWGCEEVVVTHLAKRYTFRVAAILLASLDDPEEIEKLEEPFDMVAAAILAVPIDLPGTPLNRGVKAAKAVRKEVAKMIKRRKAELAEGKPGVGHDMLSHMLVTCTDDGRYMSELDITDRIIALLVASYDTTSAVCTFVVKYLAELPHVYDAVYNEQMEIAKSKAEGELLNWEDLQKMKYSWNVAQEVLRIASPSQGGFREATSDFTFDSFSIPKGWKLFWSTFATHKNPAYFPDPDRFDPTRFEGAGPAPHTFIPFGGGPRMCPGREYARVKILVFMHNLVKRYRWEKIVPDEKTTIVSMPTPEKGLPVRLFPHSDR